MASRTALVAKWIGIVAAGLMFAALVQEYATIRYKVPEYSLSALIIRATDWVGEGAAWLGARVAVLSAYLDFLVHLLVVEDLKLAIARLAHAAWYMAVIPLAEFSAAFFKRAWAFTSPHLVVIGALVGVFVLAFCFYLRRELWAQAKLTWAKLARHIPPGPTHVDHPNNKAYAAKTK